MGWTGTEIVTYPVKAVYTVTLPASIGGSHGLRNEKNSDTWIASVMGQSALDIAKSIARSDRASIIAWQMQDLH